MKLLAGGIGGCTLTADDAKVAYKIWGNSVPRLKGSIVLSERLVNASLRAW